MAKEFAVPHTVHAELYKSVYDPERGQIFKLGGDFPVRVARRLSAVDYFRTGHIFDALVDGYSQRFYDQNEHRISEKAEEIGDALRHCTYYNQPEDWKANMRALAKALAKEGL